MQKLNFLLLLLLIGCSSTSPEENVYVVEESKMTISKIKPQLAQPNYKQQRSSSQETTVSYSPSARENVFSLLERNHRQLKRIYQESIKKEILQEQLVPIKNRKEKSPNIQKLIPLSPRTQKPTQQTLDSKEKKNEDCIKYCGEGYFYDRPGAKNNGEERVCTKYPLKCGYNCTRGWKFRYLVDNTNYTCQEAQQIPDNETTN